MRQEERNRKNQNDPLLGSEVIIDTSDPETRARKRLAPAIHLLEVKVEGRIERKITHSDGRRLYLVRLKQRLTDPGRFETDFLIAWPSMEGEKILADLNSHGVSGVVLATVPLGREVPDIIVGYDEFPSFGVGRLYLK